MALKRRESVRSFRSSRKSIFGMNPSIFFDLAVSAQLRNTSPCLALTWIVVTVFFPNRLAKRRAKVFIVVARPVSMFTASLLVIDFRSAIRSCAASLAIS